MTGEELQARLDGRSFQWLANYLGLSRSHVSEWAAGIRRIPERHVPVIRERLPLPGEQRSER